MSPLRYSVVRYVPDPIREEYVNVGVAVASDDGGFAKCRFTTNWERARRFGREDVAFLRRFAVDLTEATSTQPDLFTRPFDGTQLTNFSDNWRNSVQFSMPRASVEADPETLLQRLFDEFVQEPATQSTHRSLLIKSKVVSHVRKELEDLLQTAQFRGAAPQVRTRQRLKGNISQHEFDLVINRGQPLVCLDAISVKGDELTRNESVRATAFDVQDVLANHKRLQIAILLIAASPEQFDGAKKIYRRLGATVFAEPGISGWAKRTVKSL